MFLRTLVATDSHAAVRRIETSLQRSEAIVRPVDSVEELWRRLAVEPFDLVVLDCAWRPAADPRLIPQLLDLPEAPEVVVLLEQEDAPRRAALLASGAYEALCRDLPEELFREALRTLAERRLGESRARLQSIPDEDYRLGDYATRSPAMQGVLRLARRIAERDTTVLLLGETGVGKGLLARSLHNEGPRAAGPFVAMNCGALTESLLEAELFGHERGAYTGADRARRGYFELAHRGTLFLDEIAELPLHLQVKLLQVVEERRVRPVGAEKKVDVDVRLIAATNRDLPEAVRQRRFREDLYYRLNVVTLTLPPLRERIEDIPEIAGSYAEHFCAQVGTEPKRLSRSAMDVLLAYPWPGNVRELANAIERAVIMGREKEIRVEDLAVGIRGTDSRPVAGPPVAVRTAADPGWLRRSWSEVRQDVVAEAEVRYLRGLLRDTRGRIAETASRAGMDPRSLREKMKRYGLRKEDFRI